MLKMLIHKAARQGIWPCTVMVRTARKRSIQRRIDNGAYDPAPREWVHFPDYERAIPGEAIPKVIHYTWKSRELTPFFRECKQTIESHHPQWQHKLWLDEDMLTLVDQSFPQYSERFRLLPKFIMRVDTFRYMLLHAHGGVYSDLDVIAYRPYDEMLADCRLMIPCETDLQDSDHFLAQHLMASVPGHVYWLDVIAEILDRSEDDIRRYDNPLIATGPKAVTRVWRRDPKRYGIKIPKSAVFCPPSEFYYLKIAPHQPPILCMFAQAHGCNSCPAPRPPPPSAPRFTHVTRKP